MKKGVQDIHFAKITIKDREDMMDSRNILIGKDPFQVSYGRIEVGLKKCYQNTDMRFYLKKEQCDLVNMIDLVIPNPENIPTNTLVEEWIQSVKVECGGHRFDAVFSARQLLVVASIFNRFPHTANNTTYVPLALAPFHQNNLVPPSLTHHNCVICVKLNKPLEGSWDLCGMRYIFHNKHTLNLHNAFITHQQQSWGSDAVQRGINRVRLNLNHPVRLIYFWGIDSTLVKKVRLVLDDTVCFEGTLQDLERGKNLFGRSTVDAHMLVLSYEEFDRFPQSTINFSAYDDAFLEIETDQEEGTMNVCGLNINEYVWSCGMIGMKF